jgi:hypothetical protein
VPSFCNWAETAAAVLITGFVAAHLMGCSPLPAGRAKAPAPPTEQADRYGELELVTHHRSDASGDSGAQVSTAYWSLRWQGRPLDIDTMTGMWGDQPTRTRTVHAVYLLGPQAAPDLLVHVGDPNNTGAYHLLYQQDGRLHTPLVCSLWGGDGRITRLDVPGTAQGPSTSYEGPEHRPLLAARWLMLGKRCVLDVQRRRGLMLPANELEGPTVMPEVHLHSLSPDGRSLARLGYQQVDGDRVQVVMVAELDGDHWTTLPIDRQRMRYDNVHAVDDAWLAHHFEWRHDAKGHDRLQRRNGFKPLPWRGSIEPSGRAYVLHSARFDRAEVFAGVLMRRFQGQPLPRTAGASTQVFQVRGEPVTVDRSTISAGNNAPYWPGQPGDPNRSIALVREIAQAVDEELATGRHDALFVDPDARR